MSEKPPSISSSELRGLSGEVRWEVSNGIVVLKKTGTTWARDAANPNDTATGDVIIDGGRWEDFPGRAWGPGELELVRDRAYFDLCETYTSDRTNPPSNECAYCGGEWHPDKFHPGCCAECGGPKNG